MSTELFVPLLIIIYVLTVMLFVTLAVIAWGYNDMLTVFKCAATIIIYSAYIVRTWRKYR